jgi:hypothetical protein
LDHITISIHTIHRIIIHAAFFLAESSVAVANPITLPAINKKIAQITKYRTIFMKGYIMWLYRLSANLIQLGPVATSPNSCSIIPLFQTNPLAINLADTITIIHIIQNNTNLIHSLRVSSLSDVIILYPPKNATAIHITINMSII